MSHDAQKASGASHSSFKGYATGFLLSLVLTIISFALVMDGTLSHTVIMVGIILAAVVQLMVQMHYFLHLDGSSAQRWNVMALLYTLLIVAILIGGTVWIMVNTQQHMMGSAMSMAH